MGCGVPDVNFGPTDAAATPDAREAATIDTGTDQESEADALEDGGSDGPGDAADAMDAPQEATDYCTGGMSPPPPAPYKCCGGNTGVVCSGSCNMPSCNQCTATGPCTWPNVCCTTGNSGVCKDGGC